MIDEESPQEPITVQVENIFDPAVLIINKARGAGRLVLIPLVQLCSAPSWNARSASREHYSGEVPFGVDSARVSSRG